MRKQLLAVEQLGAGPDLVLLHGWGMHSGVWEPMLPTLVKQFRVTLIDLPGHGLSPAQAFLPIETLLDELLLVAPLGRVHWMGWSLGGMLALAAADYAPQRCASLTMVASNLRFIQDEDWPCAMRLADFSEFAAEVLAAPQAALKRFIALQTLGAGGLAAQAKQTLQLTLQAHPPSVAGLKGGLELLAELDNRGAMSRVSCPTLFVLGARDKLVPATLADCVASMCPGVQQVLLEGAGHAPFLSHRDVFSEHIVEFLNRHGR